MKRNNSPHDISIDELFLQYDKCKDKKNEIVSFFLASLSTGNFLWRSFLPAFAIVRTYPKHYFAGSRKEEPFMESPCEICSEQSWIGIKPEDYEFYTNRAKETGGIAVFNIKYCIVLLTVFNNIIMSIKPTETDIEVFEEIMSCLSLMENNGILKKDIIQKIKKIPKFRGDKFQIKCLLQTLGFCGILETEQHQSPFHGYINLELAPKKSYKSDWAYPVDFWEPSDGINKKAFKYWFGDYPQLERFGDNY